ncbi:UNKNOWN [Stylonychia lemnae]|uniref:Uncharacterized protein n=1 Tax=Stylonychia lemnae TaxID=5949 RepID=A0A078B8K0_STYLE|nr:UNKNOWN [Stylonychia lemnae]|eukprot:CDW90845.1 UNKNOWN [Stylonychia lemnae]
MIPLESKEKNLLTSQSKNSDKELFFVEHFIRLQEGTCILFRDKIGIQSQQNVNLLINGYPSAFGFDIEQPEEKQIKEEDEVMLQDDLQLALTTILLDQNEFIQFLKGKIPQIPHLPMSIYSAIITEEK